MWCYVVVEDVVRCLCIVWYARGIDFVVHIDTGTPSMLYLSCALTLQKKGITCTRFGGWLRLVFSVCRSGVHAGSLLLVKLCLRWSALSKGFGFSISQPIVVRRHDGNFV